MEGLFQNKVIVVLSPQPWNYLFISKHHYARELSRNNKVFYVDPPTHGRWFQFSGTNSRNNKRVTLVDYVIPVPNWLRFKLPWLYKKVVSFYLVKALKGLVGKADVCFDFGCYQQFDSIDFIAAEKKFFFPVDDMELIKGDKRGSSLVFSVSPMILKKFKKGEAFFINHGLSDEFAMITRQQVSVGIETHEAPIKVGYAGNLFIKFLDTRILMEAIINHPTAEYHFFGSMEANFSITWHREWMAFLKVSPNVKLHGVLSTGNLALALNEMDILLLCYKPDYINYHGENSHKVLEYLSTGKVVVSSYISVYDKNPLIQMAGKDSNEEIIPLFHQVILNLPTYNSASLMNERRLFALDNTYQKQLERIEVIVSKSEI